MRSPRESLNKLHDMGLEKRRKWTPKQIQEIDDYITELHKLLENKARNWIRQACNSQQQVTDYRIKMERAQKTLNTLGLERLAKELNAHMARMISSVEQRFRYKMAIDEATGLNRHP